MRINKYVASATGMSRRAADKAIESGRVSIDNTPATQGLNVSETASVTLDGKPLKPKAITTIALHKPVGYVCSRDGQGSKTVYELLPSELSHLKPIGRLDKDSSGLLLLSNDGALAESLTHPSKQKTKRYVVTVDHDLQPLHRQMIQEYGIQLEDGASSFMLERIFDSNDKRWIVTMSEGRNRQIRRTFEALNYSVVALHRIQFGTYQLGDLKTGSYIKVLSNK